MKRFQKFFYHTVPDISIGFCGMKVLAFYLHLLYPLGISLLERKSWTETKTELRKKFLPTYAVCMIATLVRDHSPIL